MNNHTVEPVGRNVLIVRFTGISAGWEQWVLLSADRHHDNVYCDRDLERRHLEQVKERGGFVIDAGDLFCAMQGKWDPRSNMDDIRPEDVGQDYLDRIAKHAAEFYGPYADRFLVIGKGNHETSVLNRHGVDLTSNLVHRMNSEHGGQVAIGGYGGWVRFQFERHGTGRMSKNLKYFHGAGGGGPVTRGVIQTNRQAVYLPDADIVLNGHTHDSWLLSRGRERLTQQGRVKKDLIHFVRTPGYKDEYADGFSGFHVERWGDPRPIGAVWLRFFYHDRDIELELTQAIV
jgi:hypothetical protein